MEQEITCQDQTLRKIYIHLNRMNDPMMNLNLKEKAMVTHLE